MILVDGVRYMIRAPSSENDLTEMVREHSKDIWGENSVYFDKKKLRTSAGIASIPDGYVIIFESPPQWYVVEVELSSHPIYQHIVPQVSKFALGVGNTGSQHEIANAVYRAIQQDNVLEAWVKNKVAPSEIYKFLMEIVSKPPVVAIIIDEKTKELEEACQQLPTKVHSVKVMELKTFQRYGCESIVHAHVFEPLYQIAGGTNSQVDENGAIVPPQGPKDFLEITVPSPSFRKFHLFNIPKGRRHFFPGYRIPFHLETDIGTIQTYVTSAPRGTEFGNPDAGVYVQSKLADWYRAHPKINVGNKIVVEVIEPMKRYGLKTA